MTVMKKVMFLSSYRHKRVTSDLAEKISVAF